MSFTFFTSFKAELKFCKRTALETLTFNTTLAFEVTVTCFSIYIHIQCFYYRWHSMFLTSIFVVSFPFEVTHIDIGRVDVVRIRTGFVRFENHSVVIIWKKNIESLFFLNLFIVVAENKQIFKKLLNTKKLTMFYSDVINRPNKKYSIKSFDVKTN